MSKRSAKPTGRESKADRGPKPGQGSKSAKGPERARAIAAATLAQQRAAQRRRTTAMVAGVVVILLLIAGGIGYAVYDSSSKPKAAYAAPQGGTSTSVLVGSASAKVTVDLYVDFQCPVCKNFEATTGPALQKLVDDRAIKIAYHPVAYLDRFSSGTRYSSRSSSAAACAADAGVFAKFAALLFANQPVENGNGLSNDKLVTLGQQAGATSADFATCIRRERYRDWTAGLTDQASKDGVNGTPTIMVDGAAVGTNGQVPTTEQVTTAIKNATA